MALSIVSAGLFWVGLALLVIYLPISYYLNYRKCSQVKGPWLASISNLWLLNVTSKARVDVDCAAQLEKYGVFARIAPGKIVTNDPDLWRYMSAPRSTFTKGTWYDSMTLDPKTKNSLSEKDDKLHNKLRAKMIRGYSGKDIPMLEATVDQIVSDLIDLIRRSTDTQTPVDIARLCQYFTLDVLTHIAFGAPFGFVKKHEDVFKYVETISGFLGVLELASNSPTINSIFNSKLMAFMQPKDTDPTGMGAMLGVAKRVVNERFAPDAKPLEDMLGSFIKHGMTPEEAKAESMLQILGGSDSTATSIRMIFLYIMSNPPVYTKLVAEIDAANARGVLSHPVIKSSESQTELPYLQACIKEGLRMYPPLVGLQGKVTPTGGFDWQGIHIPAGIEICWNPKSMQRRPEIYGKDADIFRPARWLEAAAEPSLNGETGSKLTKMNQTLDLIFGHGKYGCLGKTVALMELDKIFVALFDNFEFTLVDPIKPMRTACHGAHVQTDMWVRTSERKK